MVSRHPPIPTTIKSPTALSMDVDSSRNPHILRRLIMAQLNTMRITVSGTMRQKQAHFKLYLDKKVSSLHVFTVCQMLYVKRPSSTLLVTDRQTSENITHYYLETQDPLIYSKYETLSELPTKRKLQIQFQEIERHAPIFSTTNVALSTCKLRDTQQKPTRS